MPVDASGANMSSVAKNPGRYLEAERHLWEKLGVAPVERRVTLASGGEVRIQEVGDGLPVVFIHGATVAGTSWCQLAARLDGVRCILVDRPGCGLSDPIVGGPVPDLAGLETYTDRFLSDLLDALELERSVWGHRPSRSHWRRAWPDSRACRR